MNRQAVRGLPSPFPGDRAAFVALMIPHHKSPVEMARIYLKHGKDAELRRLAGNVVPSQEAEIRQMSRRGAAPASGSATPAAGPHPGH